MSPAERHDEAVTLLSKLIRFDTVNPPGNERPAIEHLERHLREAGFATEILAAEPERPNLVATLAAPDGADAGPVLGLLGHVDTVLADADQWRHDPWSGEVIDGELWGRGAIDMKSQVAAEAAAGAARARDGWRPARGALRLVFVSDEETGGGIGADWLTSEHPDKVRCDFLLNEGAGAVFEYDGRRHYGVCCAEKGIFRFTLTARGIAGHAATPALADNALLKLGPLLQALADPPDGYEVTEAPAALLRALGEDPDDPGRSLANLRERHPQLHALATSMFQITLTPTMASASPQMNVIPSRAQLRVDCRVPAGLGEDDARRRIEQVLGPLAADVEIEFFECIPSNQSPVDSPMMDAIARWIETRDPGAAATPMILNGFSDSVRFRDAFPECVAYGFFPMRHQSFPEAAGLMHNADERIDVRDLAFATDCYHHLIGELLG